ncbi:hypothetical protein [Lentilactobacillus buchneri]|uniref:Uncharacterized protein n=1 Tax=Lentilactobacillus buchneri subsp. silagei CD034 TaxID=1071400 RepID=J9WBE8_LENBU|nr:MULTISPECIES: hypothetical protein [Lentilactobacillus]MCC6102062.1 hypothetical protein [Lactobacillus sp.]AFS01331.1 hypothetical protein LBUCD034_2362 [Lentilactobacillus buchneri subsp. silagei CD034]MCT2901057.1 hypothetical protein [Lentilactobacillus buchneri]MCT3542710.1 hypothetical protein [Lentilactobacillus buchneri]MCT3545851.1 hypothetical protein [Lentilactobacillus buchneri]
MKFNWKIALISFSPYIPLIVIYLLIHLYVANDVVALLFTLGVFSAGYIFVHYKYAKTFFSNHPELDLQNFEFNTVANVVLALWIIVMVGLIILRLYPQSPEGYLLAFDLFYSVINGFKSYRRAAK